MTTGDEVATLTDAELIRRFRTLDGGRTAERQASLWSGYRFNNEGPGGGLYPRSRMIPYWRSSAIAGRRASTCSAAG